jgi:hypothetical protein
LIVNRVGDWNRPIHGNADEGIDALGGRGCDGLVGQE